MLIDENLFYYPLESGFDVHPDIARAWKLRNDLLIEAGHLARLTYPHLISPESDASCFAAVGTVVASACRYCGGASFRTNARERWDECAGCGASQ